MDKVIKVKNLLKIAIIFALGLFSTAGYSLSSDWAISEKSKVRLISPMTASNNNNQLILALEYELEEEWKTYWKSPGGGGFPQKIIWNNSSNVKDIKILWPEPIEFEILGLKSIGYKDKVIFPLIVDIEDNQKQTNLNLNINYLVCRDICIPGNADIFLDLPSGDGEYTDYFFEIEKVLSTTLNNNIDFTPISNFSFKAIENNNSVIFDIEISTTSFFDDPKIFIHTPFGLPVVEPINNYSLDFQKLKTSFNFRLDQFNEKKFPIEIFFYDNNHSFKVEKNVEIENVDKNISTKNSLLYLLLISLLGGFILNLMPCVFPVLSLKLLSVINTEDKKIKSSFFITVLGIITSFLILGSFFAILKQINISISWGMQFQEPYFLMFILTIISMFFLNTLGLFQINLPSFLFSSKILNSGNNFYTKNFFNGFFATLLATPCSAPYLGTAVTAAFTQSTTYLFLIFFFMGIGMSLPYLIIAFFPGLISFLPRSGKWMIYFKYFLSILLFITIVWLLSILNNYFNYFFIVTFTVLLILISAILKFRIYQTPLIISLIIIFFLTPYLNSFQKINEENYKSNNWLDFNSKSIPEIIVNNEIVFLDITADWCITCKFNKINVLNSKTVSDFFDSQEVTLIKADWTQPNEKINKFLKKYNKFGIPFNAFYSSKFPEGIVMNEILTEKQIFETYNKVK
ncbi:MAG: protein-disulfide reductase DsbD family protein [Alphaproteobacteria bacterium]